MIGIYFGFFSLLGICGLLWYVFYDIMAQFIVTIQTFQPGSLESETLAFIEALWDWFPWLLLVAGLIFVVVNSQRGM